MPIVKGIAYIDNLLTNLWFRLWRINNITINMPVALGMLIVSF